MNYRNPDADPVNPFARRGAAIVCVILFILFGMATSPGFAEAFSPLPPGNIHLGGEIGRRIEATIDNNLLAVDVDKDFLQPFQERNSPDGYVGLGKFLESLARFTAYSKDARLRERLEHVVHAILKIQEADGYIGIMPPGQRIYTLWDVHEMSYLLNGLSAYAGLFDEADAKDAARRLADYLVGRLTETSGRPVGSPDLSQELCTLGLEQAMLRAYSVLGDARYLEFVRDTRRLPEWKLGMVCGRWGRIEGHAYAYLARCVAQLRLNAIEPDARLLEQSGQALAFLTQQDGLVITGTCSDHECWHDNQEGTLNLGETCATAYLIRWWDALLRLTGDARYGDLIERAAYNALFAAQSPDGRSIRYYTPFDGPRKYFEKDTYCCPNNFRRIVSELPGMIFYASDQGIAVNLYTPAEASLKMPDGLAVTVKQETDYPNGGRVRLVVTPEHAAAFSVLFRIPRWCQEARIAVNGTPWEGVATRGAFAAIEREWAPGDAAELTMAMPPRWVKGRKAQAGHVALMQGPQVFCLNRVRNRLAPEMELRFITIVPETLEGPFPDDSVRPGGQAWRVKGYKPGGWYPGPAPDLDLTLSEYPDPGGEAIYFRVPNPKLDTFAEDELEEPIPIAAAR